MPVSIRHLITKYGEGGHWWAESWVQIDAPGMCWCLCRRRICIDGVLGHTEDIPGHVPAHATA